MGTIGATTLLFLIGVLNSSVRGAPSNNTGNHYYNYGGHYGHYGDYGGNKHPGHHEYEDGDDLFGHVETNLTHDDDHAHIYHDYVNYGFSHHAHDNGTEEGGGGGTDKKPANNNSSSICVTRLGTLILLVVLVLAATDNW